MSRVNSRSDLVADRINELENWLEEVTNCIAQREKVKKYRREGKRYNTVRRLTIFNWSSRASRMKENRNEENIIKGNVVVLKYVHIL